MRDDYTEDQPTEELPQVLDVEVVDMQDDHYRQLYPYQDMGYNPREFGETKKRINTVMIMALIAAAFGLVIMVYMFFSVLFFFR